MRFDNRLSLFVLAFVHQVKIFLERRPDARLGGRLLTGFVEQALRRERVHLLAMLVDVHDRPLAGIVRAVVLGEGAADAFGTSDGHVVAVRQSVARFLILIESRASESEDDDPGAEGADVAYVAARVAMRELDHGGEHALSSMTGNVFTAAIKLAGDGQRDERAKAERHQ